MTEQHISPYAAALGDSRHDLPPTLQRYFDTIPRGQVGIGVGTFDTVGTRRRWLWPILLILQRRGVLPAGWFTDVPFRVENRTIGRQNHSRRILMLPRGEWVMTDVIRTGSTGVIDTIGTPATVASAFTLTMTESGLAMDSTRVGLSLGPVRVRVPHWLAPRVHVTESVVGGRQRFAFTMDIPVIGRLYEYGGSFDYDIQEDA